MTYSIVARDPSTLEMGVGVQSHWFSVGSVVPFARAGVGAVAVQSVPAPDAGPRVLEALAGGADAREALRVALAADDEQGMRQTGVVDARGRAAGWTGGDCIVHAGDVSGPGFTTQANMMRGPGVPEAMAAAFERSGGRLAERLLAALDAAEAAGGDVRGRQSAALLLVPGEGPSHARTVDLRVDDHADPLGELRRLLVLHRAYELAAQADELVAHGAHGQAGALYERAAALAPGSDELVFWAGLAAAESGGVEAGLPHVREAIARNPRWRELLERLGPAVAPSAEAVRRALDD